MVLDKLIEALDKHFGFEEPTPTEEVQQQVKFYVHFKLEDLQIHSISANDAAEDGFGLLEIDYELGMKFMLGVENAVNWVITKKNNQYHLSNKEAAPLMGRMELGYGMVGLQPTTMRGDVAIVVNKAEDSIYIHYDGNKIQAHSQPIRLYFTKEGDISYLKFTFHLDVNILDKIMFDNDLTEWPNPIKLKMKDVDDLSVFTLHHPLSVTLHEQTFD